MLECLFLCYPSKLVKKKNDFAKKHEIFYSNKIKFEIPPSVMMSKFYGTHKISYTLRTVQCMSQIGNKIREVKICSFNFSFQSIWLRMSICSLIKWIDLQSTWNCIISCWKLRLTFYCFAYLWGPQTGDRVNEMLKYWNIEMKPFLFQWYS